LYPFCKYAALEFSYDRSSGIFGSELESTHTHTHRWGGTSWRLKTGPACCCNDHRAAILVARSVGQSGLASTAEACTCVVCHRQRVVPVLTFEKYEAQQSEGASGARHHPLCRMGELPAHPPTAYAYYCLLACGELSAVRQRLCAHAHPHPRTCRGSSKLGHLGTDQIHSTLQTDVLSRTHPTKNTRASKTPTPGTSERVLPLVDTMATLGLARPCSLKRQHSRAATHAPTAATPPTLTHVVRSGTS
jgi:hypothetical protein